MISLQDYSKIPVKNIYYMLCYAWDRLKEKDNVKIGQEDEKDIYHLLTRILVHSLRSLIKRGFYREYKLESEETTTLRGKIHFKESLSRFSYKRARMVCDYDELTHDIPHNQIIKSTLYGLITCGHLDNNLKKEVSNLLTAFGGISIVKLSSRHFKELRLHKNNMHYGFVLDICKLLFDQLLLNEEQSQSTFKDFQRDHKAMANLFEKFVFNFYKNEVKEYKVKRENIYWDATGEDTAYLPIMQTDITLISHSTKVIIDTKYYHQALTSHFDSEKVISGNLYQMYAYLNNDQEKERDKVGMLLYPKVDKELNLSFQLKEYPIRVCTVDLTRDWKVIHERLEELIKL
ncbi:5-methylcytosine-specific restriction endonuclease system specificity protein McrC [Alkalihalophilus marmarensis]|uniref:5-methylcytosine-specific restriction endonuclease system specificity protein McrC n=1 Tax=Alkalihalophilus marmarensis TaxID=521377 RepID=UPI00203AFDFA|nr:5-methylcytosine-specific restriction endonuclease system specificity protein McrC [Alkalihalophilus marmarensis]